MALYRYLDYGCMIHIVFCIQITCFWFDVVCWLMFCMYI